ncbi:MAG: prohibitin family protein [Ignavibacteria bacterium]|nr:prohibitin family protein [Ignavibacteria bacterium]
MIATVIFLLLVLIAVTIVKKYNAENKPALKIYKLIRIVTIVLICVLFVLSTVVQIGPGEAGVPILFGSVQDNILTSGLNIVNPLVTVEILDIKTQAYTMSSLQDEGSLTRDDAITTLSSDGLSLKLDLTVWFRVSSSEAPNLIRTIGVNYLDKIVRPAARTAIRDVSVKYVATDIYSSKRDDFVNDIYKNLESSFQGRGIILEKVLLRNVELPSKVREAIDEKISAEQRAQQMVYVLQKEKQEAERKRVEAEGIAQAQKIISNTINPQYLQWKYIETLKEFTTSSNNTIVITPYDQKLTPLLNLNPNK